MDLCDQKHVSNSREKCGYRDVSYRSNESHSDNPAYHEKDNKTDCGKDADHDKVSRGQFFCFVGVHFYSSLIKLYIEQNKSNQGCSDASDTVKPFKLQRIKDCLFAHMFKSPKKRRRRQFIGRSKTFH